MTERTILLDRVFTLAPGYVVIALCLGNDLTDNVRYSPYNHPKPYAALTEDGNGYVVKGYPLPVTKTAGTFLIGGASASRRIGMLEFLYYQMTKPKSEGDESVEEALLYSPPEKAKPVGAKITQAAFKLNEMILADIKKKIEAALGPGRFAVLLVPTKFEMGEKLTYPDFDRNYVGDQVKASLTRLGIPAIDGRQVIKPSDFTG